MSHDDHVLTLAEVVSVVIWVAVLLGLWIEYRYGITTFGAFFLPVILALGLGLPTGLRDLALEPQSQSGWALVHVTLVLVGMAALPNTSDGPPSPAASGPPATSAPLSARFRIV